MSKLKINNVIIGTTDMCNARCVICPPQKDGGNIMDMKLFERIIDTVHDSGCTNQIGFGLFNEPLTDPMLLDRVKYCKETTKNETMLSTNAELLTPDKFKELEKYVDKYLVSIHGTDKAMYESIMKGLDYNVVISNVMSALRSGARVNVTMVSTKANVDSWGIFKDYWTHKGAKVERYRLSNRCGGMSNTKFDALSFAPTKGNCDKSILNDLIVDWNGDILMCCQDFSKTYTLGNITTDSLREIREGQKYKAVKAILLGKDHSELVCRLCKADPYDEKIHAW